MTLKVELLLELLLRMQHFIHFLIKFTSIGQKEV